MVLAKNKEKTMDQRINSYSSSQVDSTAAKGHGHEREGFSSRKLGRQSPAMSTSSTSPPRSSSISISTTMLPTLFPNRRLVPAPSSSSSSSTTSSKRVCPPPPIISLEGERLARLNAQAESSSQNQFWSHSQSRSPRKTVTTRRSPRQHGKRRQPQSEIEVITISTSPSPPFTPVKATTSLPPTPEPDDDDDVITLSSPPPQTFFDLVEDDDIDIGTISPAPATSPPQNQNLTTIDLPSLSPTSQQSPLIQKIINQGHRSFPNSILMPSTVSSLTSKTYLTKEVQTDPTRIINTLGFTDVATQTDPDLGDNQTMNQAISPSKKDASTFIHPHEFSFGLNDEEFLDMEGHDEGEKVRTYASVCTPLRPVPQVPSELFDLPLPEEFLTLNDENDYPGLVTGDDIDMEDVAASSTAVVVDILDIISESTEDSNWRNSNWSFEEIYDFMRKSPQYQKFMDVKFIVGQEGREKNVMGHELFLMSKCEYFTEILYGEKDNVKVIEGKGSHWRLKEVYLTEFDPNGFQLLIDYMYTGKIETSDLSVILQAADCAQKIDHSELIGELGNYLKKNFTKDNAVQVYCMAVAKNDLHLARESMTFINSNISDVVYSDGFLNLSEEDLCRFLESDDWTLGDELKVFELVKRWATHKIDPENPSRKIRSEELRRLMGQAVYGIRFSQFSDADLLQLLKSQVKLLSEGEMSKLMMYLMQKDNTELMEDEKAQIPPMFVARPRGVSRSTSVLIQKLLHPAPEAESKSATESGESEEQETSTHEEAAIDMNLDIMDVYNVILDKSSDQNMEFEPIDTDGGKQEERDRNEDNFVEAEVGNPEIECSATAVEGGSNFSEGFDSDNSSKPSIFSSTKTGPSKKRAKLTITKMGGSNSSSAVLKDITAELAAVGIPDVSKVQTLQQFKDELSGKVAALQKTLNMENLNVMEINETLLLTKIFKISSTRVYLPKLKKFEVRFVSENIMGSGAKLKEYIKGIFSKLSDILFFDVNVDHNKRKDEILENLLGTKVNILVTFAQSTILRIDHDQGKVIMNMLKGSQTDKILKGCQKSGFRLKILGVSDCDLSSFNSIPHEALEGLQIRAVKGLKGFGDFLEQCTNLKSVCWNHYNEEKIEVEKQISSKMSNLEHLALAKCSLVDFGDGRTPFENLKCLFLDHCYWDESFVQRIPQMFPSLKEIMIYGRTGDSQLLYWILKKMPSIEWVFMWEMNYVYLPSTNQEGVESARPSIVGRRKKKAKKRGSGGSMRGQSQGEAERLSGQSHVVKGFLSNVFDEKFANRDFTTFILEKKRQDEVEEQEGGDNADYNHVDDNASSEILQYSKLMLPSEDWKGEALQWPKQYTTMNTCDFKFNRHDEFFKDFGVFAVMNTGKSERHITKLLRSPYDGKKVNEEQ